MRTSEEIYHRVRWDPRFDAARFTLGVMQRGRGPKRVPLPAFTPGGDIPWHRVLFIEADGEVVWDRTAGIDTIDTSPAGRVRRPRRLREPFFAARTPFAFHPVDGWRAVTEPPEKPAPADTLRVLTWNTLWDRYDADRIDTARRRPLLLRALAEADADVIALQEVEPELVAMLLTEAWVRESYAIGTDPRGTDVAARGLLLLSRLPVEEAGCHSFGPYKGVAAITVTTAAGPLVVATTHLTSDHTERGAERRTAELARIAEGLAGLGGSAEDRAGADQVGVVVLGDVNDGSDRPAVALSLRDAWTEVHGPHDTTPTFDPTVNPLAAVSSLSGRPARLDRVLLGGRPHPLAATLVGDRPEALYASDHFGVAVTLAVTDPAGRDDVLNVPPTARTALAWLPPADAWPPVNEIRERHDPQVRRWPPHVNVLFGFVPEALFDRAAPLLAAAAGEVAPFVARMRGVHTFAHRDNTTVWLDPAADSRAAWTALHAAMTRRFPGSAARRGAFTPHLTLGRVVDPGRVATEAAARLGDRTADVGELVLLSRRGDEPMRTRATIALGTGEIRWTAEIPETGGVADGNVDGLTRTIVAALPEASVHVVGSRRMGGARAGADLDLVAAVPGAVDLTAIGGRLAAVLGSDSSVRPVLGARVPVLRLRVGRQAVDLVLVACGDVPPERAVARRAELGDAAAVALSAVTDADAVLAAVGPSARFAMLLGGVKAWARAKGLDSAPFGGLPGIAWAVLAAVALRDAPPVGREGGAGDLAHFFGTWAAWDWRETVALAGSAGPPTGAPVTVLTPTEPVRTCTAQVGPGWPDRLTSELYTAWEACTASTDPWPELLAPPPTHRRHAAFAVVIVPADEDIAGRVRGRVRALLTALESAGATDAHAWPRAYAPGRFAIGLGADPPDRATVARIAAVWGADLPGVSVEWMSGGDVPTLR